MSILLKSSEPTETDISLEKLQELRIKQDLTKSERWLMTALENLRDAEVELEWAANSLLDAQIEVTIREKQVLEKRQHETRTSK